ncbi:MAG: septation protein A [Cycloclasticus sp.]|nr:septation protein A [Cycloclasticus sp.]
MKFISDFFPILLFFIAYKLEGIYVATTVAIAASSVQVAVYWLKNKRFEPTHLFTFFIILIFGGATLYLQDEMFIKWKPTIINWLFSLACIFTAFIGKKPLIKRMMSGGITLPDDVWRKLNNIWAVFFFIQGALNLYVMYNFDTDTWVNFKLFGMMGLTVCFVIAQGFYLMKYIEDPAETNND